MLCKKICALLFKIVAKSGLPDCGVYRELCGFRTFCAGQSSVLPAHLRWAIFEQKSVRFLRFLAFKAKTSFLCSKVAIYNFLSIKRSKYIEDFQSKFCTLDFHYVHPPNKEHLKGWKEDKGPHWKNFTPLRFFKLYPPPLIQGPFGDKNASSFAFQTYLPSAW